MHVHVFSRDDDCADQALRDGLPFFKRERRQICPQQWAKGRGIGEHLLPLAALLARVGQLSTVRLDLWQRGSEFLSPRLALRQCDNLGLIGLKQALVLPLEALPPLQQLRVLRLQPREGLLCGGGPGLRQVRDHPRRPQQLRQCLPNHGLKALRTDELGGTLPRAANGQWRMPRARIGEVSVFFTGPQRADTDHAEPALAAFDEGPEHVTVQVVKT
jgi:hypothetical protein